MQFSSILEMCGLFGFLDDPRFKTTKQLSHSKECGFKSMDIKKQSIIANQESCIFKDKYN